MPSTQRQSVCFTGAQISRARVSQNEFDSLLENFPNLKVNKIHLQLLGRNGINVPKSRVY